VVLIAAAIAVRLIFFQKENKENIAEDKPNPETTIKNFEKYFNGYDMEATLNCVHPTYKDSAESLLNLLLPEKWDLSVILHLAKIGIPLIPLIPNIKALPDDLPKISLEVTGTEFDGNYAACAVSGSFTIGEFAMGFDKTVLLEIIDDTWYIVKAE
jgi:hypothetical protein